MKYGIIITKCLVCYMEMFNQVDVSLLRATHLRTSLRVWLISSNSSSFRSTFDTSVFNFKGLTVGVGVGIVVV